MYKKIRLYGIIFLISIITSINLTSAQNFTEQGQEMDAHTSKLKSIDTANLDLLSLYDCLLMDAENKLGEWYLNYDQAPADYQVKYRSIKYRTEDLRNQIWAQWLRSDTLFFLKALSTTGSQQKIYLEKSLAINSCFYDAYYYLILNNLDSMYIQVITQYFTKLSNIFYMPDELQSRFEQLAQTVYERGISQGKLYISQKQYNEALDIFAQLSTFCDSVSLYSGNCDRVREGTQQAHTGIYTAYLHVAQSAIAENKISIAKTFALKALNYQAENSTLLTTNTETISLLKKLVNYYIEQGRFYRSIGKTEKSESLFAEAKQLSALDNEQYSRDISAQIATVQSQVIETIVANTENTETSIKPKDPVKYSKKSTADLLDEGLNLLANGEYDVAIAKFEISKASEQKSNKLQEINACIAYAYKLKLLANFEKMEFLLWSDHPDKAEQLLNSTLQETRLVGLEQDQDLKSTLANYEQKARNKQCTDMQNDIQKRIAEIEHEYNLAHYSKAIELKDTLEQAYDSSSCKLTLSGLDFWIKKLQLPEHYYDLLHSAEAFLAAKDTVSFLSTYLDAEQYFNENKIDTFRIKHTPLYERIKFYQDQRLFNTVLSKYMDLHWYEQALYTLDIIYQNGLPAKEVKSQQQIIGTGLASMHKKQGQYRSVSDYYLNNKWFIIFKRAYCK